MSSFIYNTFGIKGIVATYRQNYIYGIREYIGHPHIKITYLVLIGVFPEIIYLDMLKLIDNVKELAIALSTTLFLQMVDFVPTQMFMDYLPQLLPTLDKKTLMLLNYHINNLFNNKLIYIPKLVEYHKPDVDNMFIKEIQIQYINEVKSFIVGLFSHIRMLSKPEHIGKCKIIEIKEVWQKLDPYIPQDILEEY